MDNRLLRIAGYLSKVFKVHRDEVIGWLWISLPRFEKAYNPEKGKSIDRYLTVCARNAFRREFLKSDSQQGADARRYETSGPVKPNAFRSRNSYIFEYEFSDFEKIIEDLPRIQRIFIRLRFVEDMKVTEICKYFSMSSTTAYDTLKEAITTLRKS